MTKAALYVRIDTPAHGWLAWDGSITDRPWRSETAAFEDLHEAQMAAVTAALQTHQPATVGTWTPASGTAGVFTPLITVRKGAS
jgi:hypothetical protein